MPPDALARSGSLPPGIVTAVSSGSSNGQRAPPAEAEPPGWVSVTEYFTRG